MIRSRLNIARKSAGSRYRNAGTEPIQLMSSPCVHMGGMAGVDINLNVALSEARNEPMNENDRWIADDDLAELAGFSRSYWAKQRRLGNGPPYSRIGRAVRYRLKDIVAYLEQHKVHRSIDSAKGNTNDE